MFLTVLVAQIVDAVLGGLADVLKDFTVSFWGVALFGGISLVYGFGQYSILGSIKILAKRESALLDIAASAEAGQDIENKVLIAVRANAELIEEQSGVEPTLTDTEIREQLEAVRKELKRYR